MKEKRKNKGYLKAKGISPGIFMDSLQGKKTGFTLIGPKDHEGNDNSRRERTHKAAFTLIELIIVIAVIAVLVLLAAPKLLNYSEKARFTRDIHLAKTLELGLEDFLVNGGKLEEHLDVISRSDIQASADKNMLLNPRGFVEVVEDGVYYELTHDFIKYHLNIIVANNENEFIMEALAAKYPVAAYAERGGKALVDRTRGLRGYVEKEKSYPVPENCPTPESQNYEFDHITGTITKYNGTEIHINIPAFLLVEDKCYRVRVIGREAFMGKGIVTVNIPSTIITIENGAFRDNELTKVIIPEGVRTIEENAFKDNELGPNMKPNEGTVSRNENIPDSPYAGDYSGVILPDNSLEYIDSRAFENNNLENVILPDSVVKIGDSVFNENPLQSITVGGSTMVGDNDINKLVIAPGTKVIQADHFKGTGIVSVVFPEGLERIEDFAFAYNELVAVNLPSSLVYVGNYAFAFNQIGPSGTIKSITFKGTEYINSLDLNGNISENGTRLKNIDELELKLLIFKVGSSTAPPPVVEAPVSSVVFNANSIDSGISHYLMIGEGGSVWSWGVNSHGQLGNGSTSYTNISTPIQVKDASGTGYLADVITVKAGENMSAALKRDGTVWTWGRLGSSTLPVKVEGLPFITTIATGDGHIVAVDIDGNLWGWGSNSVGQLGLGSITKYFYNPVKISTVKNVKSVDADSRFTIAVDGNSYTWGMGAGPFGSANRDSIAYAPTRVTAKPTMAGQLFGTTLVGASSVAVGKDHVLLLMNDGSLYTWGHNWYGQRGYGNTNYIELEASRISSYNVKQQRIMAGAYQTFTIDINGQFWAWGKDLGLKPSTQSGLNLNGNVVDAFSVDAMTFIVMEDGSVRMWGENTNASWGPLGTITKASEFYLPEGLGFID